MSSLIQRFIVFIVAALIWRTNGGGVKEQTKLPCYSSSASSEGLPFIEKSSSFSAVTMAFRLQNRWLSGALLRLRSSHR